VVRGRIGPNTVLELGENQLLLGPAELLHQGLLGILGRDSTETNRSDLDLDFISHLGLRLNSASVKNRNLVVLRDDFLGNDELGERLDVAVFLVYLNA